MPPRPRPVSWLQDSEWAALHAQIRPNTRSVDDFRDLVLSGRLDVYKRDEMDKVMRFLKQLLRARGRLKDVDATGKSSVTKPQLASQIAKLVAQDDAEEDGNQEETQEETDLLPLQQGRRRQPRRDDGESAASATPPAATSPPSRSAAVPRSPRPKVLTTAALSTTPVEFTTSAPPPPPAPAQGSSRHLEVPHPVLPALPATVAAAAPLQAGYLGRGQSPKQLPSAANSVEPPSALSLGKVRATKLPNSQPQVPPPPPAAAAAPRFPLWSGPIPLKPQNVTAFEPYESPLAPVDSSLARIPLRMGNTTRTVDITPSLMTKLNERSYRLVLFPVDGVTFVPAPWPAAKDAAITVNRQPFSGSWKRNWPAKKCEMKRTYLMVDITALVSRHKSTQTISIDCFARDYYSMVVVAIVASMQENIVAGSIRDRQGYRAYVAHEALRRVYTDALQQQGEEGDVEIDASTVTVLDPISRGRIVIPVRGARCDHLQCVDLQSLLRTCHIQCYWNCPYCDRGMGVEDVVVDTYMAAALSNPSLALDAQLQLVVDPTVSVGFRWAVTSSEVPQSSPAAAAAAAHSHRKHSSTATLTELTDDDEDDEDENGIPQYVMYGGKKIVRVSRRKNCGTSDAPIEID